LPEPKAGLTEAARIHRTRARFRGVRRPFLERRQRSVNEPAQHGNELFAIERFGQVMVKARRKGPIPIFRSRERRHGDSRYARQSLLLLQSASALEEGVTVLSGHPNVRYDGIG